MKNGHKVISDFILTTKDAIFVLQEWLAMLERQQGQEEIEPGEGGTMAAASGPVRVFPLYPSFDFPVLGLSRSFSTPQKITRAKSLFEAIQDE